MPNRIRTGDHRGFNKGRTLKFRVGSLILQTPEEGRRTYQPKRCGNNNNYENNSLKTLNDKKHSLWVFLRQHQPAVFNWYLRECKFSEVSGIHLTIIADHNNVVILIVKILPMISSSPGIFKAFSRCSMGTNYKWYHRHSHFPQFSEKSEW